MTKTRTLSNAERFLLLDTLTGIGYSIEDAKAMIASTKDAIDWFDRMSNYPRLRDHRPWCIASIDPERIEVPSPRFRLEVGLFATHQALLAELNDNDVELYGFDEITAILRRIPLVQKRQHLESYEVTSRNLAIPPEGSNWFNIYIQSMQRGLGELPQEYPFLLAIDQARQLKKYRQCGLGVGERFKVVTWPVKNGLGCPVHIHVWRRTMSKVSIDLQFLHEDHLWGPDVQWLFSAPNTIQL